MELVEKKPAASPSDRFQKSVSNTTERTSNISSSNHRQDRAPPIAARDRPTYALRLRAEPGVDAIRALRAVLKILLRRHGLRCVSAYEEKGGGQ